MARKPCRSAKDPMQITSRFTIAAHIITCIDIFRNSETVTSAFLAGSTGANPVIVRTVMGQLKEAGIILSSRGKSGMDLGRSLEEITLLDIYKAVECVSGEGLFHFHEHPNMACPVGRNIHAILEGKLAEAQAALEESLKAKTMAEVVRDARNVITAEKSNR